MSWIEDARFLRAVPVMRSMSGYENLHLTPEEGFVLSRVDGVSTIDEICLVASMEKKQTLAALAKLHDAAVIEIPGGPPPRSSDAVEEEDDPGSPSHGSDAAALQGEHTASDAAAAAVIPPFTSEAECDLSEEKQRNIYELFHTLDTLDFFTLLGLEPGCSGSDVQRAYRKLSLRYHPDRFYGKSLGTYKMRLEAIFYHASNVVEYLSDDSQRAAYEQELAEERAAAAEALRDEIRDGAPRDAEAGGAAANGARSGESQAAARALTREERLRRLGGVLGMSTRELKSVARRRRPGDTGAHQEVSADRAKRHETEQRKRVHKTLSPLVQRKAKAKRHFDEGIKAMLAGNFAAAASNLKLAVTFDPKNADYREKEQIATARAREKSATSYAKRAAFEESVSRWGEAARLYCLAADRHQTVGNLSKAATALIHTGDLKRAVEYAKRATELDPNSVPAKISLASAYLKAGMPKNARREAEYVLKLDPDNRTAKSLMRGVRQKD